MIQLNLFEEYITPKSKESVKVRTNSQYYTVYLTINTINSRYYYGMHQTNNPDDSYIGSGNELTKDIKNTNAVKRRTLENKKPRLNISDNEKNILSSFKFVAFAPNAVDFSRVTAKPWIDKFVGIGMQPEEQGEIKKRVGGKFISR